MVFVFLWLTLYDNLWVPPFAAYGIFSFFFYGQVIFFCIYVPHLLYPFIF